MMRTSTRIVSTDPSRMNSFSWITRRSLACVSRLMLPISSRKIDPPSATSNRPRFVAMAPVLARQAPLLEGFIDRENDFFVLERLRDVVKGAVLHRFDRAVDRRERGDDDDGQIRVGDANGAQSVDAADARQHHIENRQIDFLGIENVERFLAARRQYDVETLAAE